MYDTLKTIAKGLYGTGFALFCIYRIVKLDGFAWGGVAAVLLGFLLDGLSSYIRTRQNMKNPITTVNAAVMSHRTETWGRRQQNRKYFVKFLTEQDKSRLEFEVLPSQFESLHPGDRGVLRYRTWAFLSFVPGKRVEETVHPPVETKTIMMADEGADPGILTHELQE